MVLIMFCPWNRFSQRVCHIQIRMYFANLYVYNVVNGATVANCSHFQYISRLRLGVVWIGVKACIDVSLYDELFITSITEKHFFSPLRIIGPLSSDLLMDHYCTPLPNSWERTQQVLVHNMAYYIEPMAEA